MADWEGVRGMQMPPIELQLTDRDGLPVDLTTSTLVQLRITGTDDTEAPVVLGPMDVLAPATAGQVRYNWELADVDRIGFHYGQAIVTWSNGKKQAFPGDDDYLTLNWSESLGV